MPTTIPIETRRLGNGPQVPRIGLGLMAIGGSVYGQPGSDEERLTFLDGAYQRGETFWDTAAMYGDSEALIGKWFAANPDKRKDIFLATKFGLLGLDENKKHKVDSSPASCRASLQRSLERLGVPYVDLLYVHRVDEVTPIETTLQAMVELKTEGKVKYFGLSECGASTIRRAHAIHPITAVQMEYSPFARKIESPDVKILETARELGIAIVGYSPFGNGLLTGTIRSREDLRKPGDIRGMLPWVSESNFEANLAIINQVADLAESKEVTPAQLILAWILSQGDDFFPIPGTTNINRLEENLASISISITAKEDRLIRDLGEGVQGLRINEALGAAYQDSPALVG